MKNIWTKRGISSGTRWVSCNAVLIALVVSLSGCGNAASVSESSNEEVPTITEEASSITAEESELEYVQETETALVEDVSEIVETETALSPITGISLTYDYQHMSTHASNQMAIWVEDEDGKLVRTILVTNFTAGRRGYRERENTLSHWVAAAQPESMSDETIDAITSATPTAGSLEYFWDMTDDNGNRVADGIYTIKAEGTLYWESNVLYQAIIDTAATPEGVLDVEEIRSAPDTEENENMITNFVMTVER